MKGAHSGPAANRSTGHQPGGVKDTSDCGLIFAARNEVTGCDCVRVHALPSVMVRLVTATGIELTRALVLSWRSPVVA